MSEARQTGLDGAEFRFSQPAPITIIGAPGKRRNGALASLPMVTSIEKKWLANRLRELAAEEALAGAHSVAAEYLFRAEAIEAGRDHWRSLTAPLTAFDAVASSFAEPSLPAPALLTPRGGLATAPRR